MAIKLVLSVQVEGSPRPAVQKSTAAETAVAGSQKPAISNQPVTSRKEDTITSASKLEGKGKKKRRVSATADDSTLKAKPQSEEGEEGNAIRADTLIV